MDFKRTTQDMDTYLLEFEMMRQRAEARFDMGTGFPDEFVSALCITNASLSKNEKQLIRQVSVRRYPLCMWPRKCADCLGTLDPHGTWMPF